MNAEKKSKLGRGLDALLSSPEPAAVERSEVPIEAIAKNPYQPRKAFDGDELASLRDSIRSHGILQPLVVRQVGGTYQLIAGERRLRAAQEAGLSAVPVTVVDFNEQQSYEAALVENIQRSDLNPIEKAVGFKDYLDRYKLTHEQLAERLGMARPTITNLLALLDLPEALQASVRTGELTLGHAKILKGITDPDRQAAVAREIVSRGLSVHATTEMMKQQAGEEPVKEETPASPKTPAVKTAHVSGVEDELRQKLGMKIEIRVKGKERGQLILSFESNDDFERVVEALRR